MSDSPIQEVQIVKIYPTEYWYEKDMMGTITLKAQHEGMHECTLVQIPYDYAYTSNAGQWALLQHLCKYFGLLKDIEQRPSKFDAELIRQATSVDAIDKTKEHVEETGNNRHVFDWVCLSDSRIIEIRQINKPCDLTPWSDTLAFARALLREADAKREEVLWHFAVSGAFLNELMQMDQPSTGKWWIQ